MRVLGKRGALLIMTLWIVTILAVLAVSIGRYLSLEVRLTKFSLVREQLSALARSGVYLAMHRLDTDVLTEEGYDWLEDDWAWFPEGDSEDPSQWMIELEDGSILSIRIEDEERRIAINAITQDHDLNDRTYLALSALLASPGPARIGDYVDTNTEPFGSEGLETDDFAEPPYRAKSAPVVVEEELFSIPGLEEAQAELQSRISVASGISQLNINTVGLSVLEALGFSASNASALVGCRQTGVVFDNASAILSTAEGCMEGMSFSDEERTLLTNAFTITSHHFTVTVTGQLKTGGPAATIRALITRSPDGSEPATIVSWKEL